MVMQLPAGEPALQLQIGVLARQVLPVTPVPQERRQPGDHTRGQLRTLTQPARRKAPVQRLDNIDQIQVPLPLSGPFPDLGQRVRQPLP